MDDILGPQLRVLFVGFNPSLRSGETSRHYAGRGNQFWRLLAASGLTQRQLAPTEDRELLVFGLGSTNLVGRPTASAADLSASELRGGVPRLRDLVTHCRPKVVAYTGKGVYLAASGRTAAPWGVQITRMFPASIDFVLPSPSGLARLSFDEKLRWFQQLQELVAAGAE